MSKIKVNEIENRTGSTLTLGKCGSSVNLATGASQSGFGRTGTVDWCTTAKTSPFTAVNGKGYFINTTAGAITVTLPGSPSAGDIVAFRDYARTFSCNALTLCRNSSKISGNTDNAIISDDGNSTTIVYVDGTKGWLSVNSDTTTELGKNFYVATGGNTVITSGDFKTHIFTSDGCFAVTNLGAGPTAQSTVEYLVVAGGGASGCADQNNAYASGGGGGGGWRSFVSGSPNPINAPAGLTLTTQTYPITVGAGGTHPGTTGGNSIFSTITSTGGGQGGWDNSNPSPNNGAGHPGGSGGGGGAEGPGPGGTGNTPSVTPAQGTDGGAGNTGSGNTAGGGGGGATVAGQSAAPPPIGGDGGTGGFVPDAFFGPTAPSYGQSPSPLAPNGRYFSGGGGGGAGYPGGTGCAGGAAGAGGGAAGVNNGTASNGTANTGGGGGGSRTGKTQGGSGFVAIRYKFQ